MTTAVFAGPDEAGLADALAAEGFDVSHVDGVASRPALEETGIVDADVFVLTDVGQATAIPIARDLVDDLRIVVYTGDSLPEFAAASEVLQVDPALLDPEAVAEEVADGA
jgi:hypothetical protein